MSSILVATLQGGQRPPVLPREIAWIGLYNNDLLAWIENDNRLKELCTAREGSNEWHACAEAKRQPKLTVIAVRSAPDAGARRLGELIVVALPGVGLKAFASSGGNAEQFTPDLYDQDVGYGPWFHQLILARRGAWFQVRVPSLGAGWVNEEDWSRREVPSSDDLVRNLRAGEIVSTPRGDLFVLGVERGALRGRPEQDADMWCRGGDPPPLARWQEVSIPFDQLFDRAGRFLVRYKYTRGC